MFSPRIGRNTGQKPLVGASTRFTPDVVADNCTRLGFPVPRHFWPMLERSGAPVEIMDGVPTTGNVPWSPEGPAYDGTNYHVSPTRLTWAGPFTIAAFGVEGKYAGDYRRTFFSTGGAADGLQISLTAQYYGTGVYEFFSPAYKYVTSASSVAGFSNVMGTRLADNSIELFVNGASHGTQTGSTGDSTSAAGYTRLGAYYNSASNVCNGIVGAIAWWPGLALNVELAKAMNADWRRMLVPRPRRVYVDLGGAVVGNPWYYYAQQGDSDERMIA